MAATIEEILNQERNICPKATTFAPRDGKQRPVYQYCPTCPVISKETSNGYECPVIRKLYNKALEAFSFAGGCCKIDEYRRVIK